jgi:hypothetical protein
MPCAGGGTELGVAKARVEEDRDGGRTGARGRRPLWEVAMPVT